MSATPTTAAASAAPAHPLALPASLSPDSIDTLTELASILARLRPPQSGSAGAGAGGGTGAGGTSASAGTGPGGPGSHQAVTGTTPLPSGASAAGAPALSLKDIPAATDNLKHKLQRARAQIRGLPDMARGLAEQEAEAAALEARIARQREVLARLREVGALFAAEEAGAGPGGGKMEM